MEESITNSVKLSYFNILALFLTQADGQKHIKAGAKKVVFSAPAKDDTPTFVRNLPIR